LFLALGVGQYRLTTNHQRLSRSLLDSIAAKIPANA
jgi:hypothetical protein